MTQLSLMQKPLRFNRCERGALHCLVLDHAGEIRAAEADSVAVTVAIGSGSVQHRVGDQWADQANFYDGRIIVAAPGHRSRIRWRSAPEGIVLFASNDASLPRQTRLQDHLSSRATLQFHLDPVTLGLARALLTARTEMTGGIFEKHMVEAIVTRVANLASAPEARVGRRRSELPRWRLRRVEDMVSERLSRDVSLADMASAAGLSAMHFAAQFKAATGLRPHDYLLAQRIQQAKSLMSGTNLALYDVAINVGFRTQAHFTTVFKKFERMTPNVWRINNRSLSASSSTE